LSSPEKCLLFSARCPLGSKCSLKGSGCNKTRRDLYGFVAPNLKYPFPYPNSKENAVTLQLLMLNIF